MRPGTVSALAALALLAFAPTKAAWGDYDVQVELKNVSGQVKTDWPVVLRVYSVFGRDLGKSGLNPEGYHVYDASGQEVPHGIEVLPPADVPGNDEIIFIVPKMDAGQTLTYRITNTPAKSALRKQLDYVNSPHNLLANGDFEVLEDGKLKGFVGGAQDTEVKRSGQASLALSADGATVSAKPPKPIPLRSDSWYYFGVWSKTQNVSRHGFEAGPAASFNFTDLDTTTRPAKPVGALGSAMNQCYTRDWMKVTFEPGMSAWGLEHYAVKAARPQASVEFTLDQRRHHYMEPGKTRGTWWLDGAVLMEQPEVTVRFDKTLEPLMKNGVFVFTRGTTAAMGQFATRKEAGKDVTSSVWYSKPFAHERLIRLDRFAVKGQRVTFPVCLYHARQIKDVAALPEGMALAEADGTKLPVEFIEYCPGFGPGGSRAMEIVSEGGEPRRVTPDGAEGVRWFFITFNVPREAKSGAYAGTLKVIVDGQTLQTVPMTLRVQELTQPILRDLYVGLIHQGGALPPLTDEFLRLYGRCGFSHLMVFGGWFNYVKGEDGKMHIDEPALEKRMKTLLDNGITAGLGLYSEVQVDDKPSGHAGRMAGIAYQEGAAAPGSAELKKALDQARADRVKAGEELAAARRATTQPGATEADKDAVAAKDRALLAASLRETLAYWKTQEPVKQAYGRLIKELDAIWKKHPEWPKPIHMNWDEPQHRQSSPKMGWTQEFLPDAITTLDVQFSRMEPLLKFYNTPALDDPADWAGPEVIAWIRKHCPRVGICGAAGPDDERARYQAGMMIVACGYTYYHAWHHNFGLMFEDKDKKPCRGIAAISWAAGMNDLKAWKLLQETMDQARKEGRNPQAVKAAEEYLTGVRTVFNGDHRKTWGNEPYLGLTYTWGYDGFYDEWQQEMLRHAAAIKGVKWIEPR